MNTSSSRAIGAVVGLALALLAAGCGSMPSLQLPNMQYTQNRPFREDAAALYDASEAALDAMGYSVVRGSRAAGKLEMASRVQPSSTLRARQRQAVVTIVTLDSGESELRIAFWEASEDESAAGTVTATNRLLRGGTIYDVFWQRLATQLAQPEQMSAEGQELEKRRAGEAKFRAAIEEELAPPRPAPVSEASPPPPAEAP